MLIHGFGTCGSLALCNSTLGREEAEKEAEGAKEMSLLTHNLRLVSNF